MQSVELNAESQITLQTDYWYQPSTGYFREETRRPGEETATACAFDGERLMAFSRESGYAASYTISAYEASALASEFDPRSDSENHAASAAEEVHAAVAAKQLVDDSTEVRNGRAVIRYRAPSGQSKATKWVLVDEATGLPIEELVTLTGDGAVVTSKAYDYESIPAASVPAPLFRLALPPEITPLGDEDLPPDPSSLEVTANDAASQCSFTVFWLGNHYLGVPLQLVRVTPDRSAVTFYYRNKYGSDGAKSTGPRTTNLYEFSTGDLYGSLISGLEGAGASSEQLVIDGCTYQVWTGGTIAPTVIVARGGTTLAISGTPGDSDAKEETNRILRAAQELLEVDK
jgi:hypothetical protein